jgi:hypothetical protein
MATKHLGPFSGWQLTVIICVVFATLFFPATVWAVSGSNVFVTDAVTGARAKVDSAGNQQVHQNGTVTVAGSVTASQPTASIYRSNFVSDGPCATTAPFKCPTVAKPPAGKALVLTDIHLDVRVALATGIGEDLDFWISSDGTCDQATFTVTVDDVNPAGIGEIVLPMDTGLAIPAGEALCVLNGDSVNITAESYAFGYTVAPNAVPAAAPLSTGLPPRQR